MINTLPSMSSRSNASRPDAARPDGLALAQAISLAEVMKSEAIAEDRSFACRLAEEEARNAARAVAVHADQEDARRLAEHIAVRAQVARTQAARAQAARAQAAQAAQAARARPVHDQAVGTRVYLVEERVMVVRTTITAHLYLVPN